MNADLLEYIFDFLEPKYLMQCSCTSKKFNKICNSIAQRRADELVHRSQCIKSMVKENETTKFNNMLQSITSVEEKRALIIEATIASIQHKNALFLGTLCSCFTDIVKRHVHFILRMSDPPLDAHVANELRKLNFKDQYVYYRIDRLMRILEDD